MSFLAPYWLAADIQNLETIAQIGAGLLLFWAGAEFPFRLIQELKWVAIASGLIAMLLTIVLSLAAGHWLGWSMTQAFVTGIALSLSSTTVLSKLTGTQEEHRSAVARTMVGATAVQELAIIPLALVLPSLSEPAFTVSAGRFLVLAGKGALILAIVILLAVKLLPLFASRFGQNRKNELCVIAAVAVGFSTAALAQFLGLPLWLCAFVAGLAAGGFPCLQQSLGRLASLRNAALAVFLVALAVVVNPYKVFAHPLLLAITLLMVFIGRGVVWTTGARAFHYALPSAALVGIGLTQLGEFSYVLVQFAREEGIVDSSICNNVLLTLVVLVIAGSLVLNFGAERERPKRDPLVV